MAHDVLTINVGIKLRLPEYEITSEKDWDDHYHGNREFKSAVKFAVLEQLMNVLPLVMADGVEVPVECITNASCDTHDTEVVPTTEEQMLLDAERDNKDARWDAFHAEIHRRDKEYCEAGADDFRMIGSYSMGDLWGPISQLDEVVHKGKARVVITDGWDDNGPVYSDSVIENPTNWDMFVMFNEALKKSNDHHHVFLEGVAEGPTNIEGITEYRALTGS